MPHVRPASIHDLPGVYRVCLLAGDAGRDATSLVRDPDLLGQIYVGPYVVGEPDLALVVADDLGVGGYCLAAADEVVDRYPAHLHIDLLERVRGAGFGRALVAKQLDQLRSRGATGVHLEVATENRNAIDFYRHLGFVELRERDDALVMGISLG